MTRYNTIRFNKHIKTAGIPYMPVSVRSGTLCGRDQGPWWLRPWSQHYGGPGCEKNLRWDERDRDWCCKHFPRCPGKQSRPHRLISLNFDYFHYLRSIYGIKEVVDHIGCCACQRVLGQQGESILQVGKHTSCYTQLGVTHHTWIPVFENGTGTEKISKSSVILAVLLPIVSWGGGLIGSSWAS